MSASLYLSPQRLCKQSQNHFREARSRGVCHEAVRLCKDLPRRRNPSLHLSRTNCLFQDVLPQSGFLTPEDEYNFYRSSSLPCFCNIRIPPQRAYQYMILSDRMRYKKILNTFYLPQIQYRISEDTDAFKLILQLSVIRCKYRSLVRI